MRLLITEHLQNAFQSLKATKTRSLLTTLGIAIGVASITVILSLSSGITRVVAQQVDALGGNIAVVRPGTVHEKADFTNPIMQHSFSTSTITEDDASDIRELPSVQAAAPLMLINGSMSAEGTTVNDATIVATTPAFKDASNITIRDGQFIDSVTNSDTAVIGPQLSIDLFGTDQPIGKVFSIRGEKFTVIGVLKRMNDPVNFNNVDLDRAAIISMESGKSFHEGVAQIQQINIRASSVDQLPKVIDESRKKLLENHDNEQDFTILSGDEISQPTSQFFIAITGVMTAIAAISLVVGGIGIMNIMLVGVAERTREIGLRKAVGASNYNILSQFLTEALIMSLVGGLAGYLGGYIVAFGISTFLTFDPAITWGIAGAAAVTSIIVGVIFGLYPAFRAARKDPIESLRQYH